MLVSEGGGVDERDSVWAAGCWAGLLWDDLGYLRAKLSCEEVSTAKIATSTYSDVRPWSTERNVENVWF